MHGQRTGAAPSGGPGGKCLSPGSGEGGEAGTPSALIRAWGHGGLSASRPILEQSEGGA